MLIELESPPIWVFVFISRSTAEVRCGCRLDQQLSKQFCKLWISSSFSAYSIYAQCFIVPMHISHLMNHKSPLYQVKNQIQLSLLSSSVAIHLPCIVPNLRVTLVPQCLYTWKLCILAIIAQRQVCHIQLFPLILLTIFGLQLFWTDPFNQQNEDFLGFHFVVQYRNCCAYLQPAEVSLGTTSQVLCPSFGTL